MNKLKAVSLIVLVGLITIGLFAPTVHPSMAQSGNAQGAVISQQFGDASTVTFTPGTIPSGKVLLAQVNGVPTNFIWASSTTVTFATAPADKAIINFRGQDKKDAILRTTVTYDPASSLTLAGDTSSAFPLPGAAVGDACVVGTAATSLGANYSCFVSSTDNVKIVYNNVTGGTVNPASATFTIEVFAHN